MGLGRAAEMELDGNRGIRKGDLMDTDGDRRGYTIWLEGLPGSGKSTLAVLLAGILRGNGRKVELMDGDEVRKGLSADLGFTRKDRESHAHRVGYVSSLLSRNGVVVIVSLITPYESSRKDVRNLMQDRMIEVWLRCPVEVCATRDPKGLYKKAREGKITGLTGVDDPFEEPQGPDLIVDTDTLSKDACLTAIMAEIQRRGLD